MIPVRLGAAGVAGAAVVLTVAAGGGVFAAAVVALGVVAVVEVAMLLGAGGQRPLVPVSALGAVGAPVAVAAAGSPGWDRVPMVMAVTLLAGFTLALVTPRRRQITATLGATLLPALLVGLGAAGLVVLRSAAAGFRWTVGLLAVTALPALLGALAGRTNPGVQSTVRVITAGAAGGALLLGFAPPFGVVTVAGTVLLGLAAVWGAPALAGALAGEGGHGRDIGALSLLAPPLLAAPALAFFAFASQS